MSRRHKAKGKSVIKMTHEGLVQKDLSTGETSKLSQRASEIELHSSDTSAEQFLYKSETSQDFSKKGQRPTFHSADASNHSERSSPARHVDQKNAPFQDNISETSSVFAHPDISNHATNKVETAEQPICDPSFSDREDDFSDTNEPYRDDLQPPESHQYYTRDHISPAAFSVSYHTRYDQEYHKSRRTEEDSTPIKNQDADFSHHTPANEYRPKESRFQYSHIDNSQQVRPSHTEKRQTHFSEKIPDAFSNEGSPSSTVPDSFSEPFRQEGHVSKKSDFRGLGAHAQPEASDHSFSKESRSRAFKDSRTQYRLEDNTKNPKYESLKTDTFTENASPGRIYQEETPRYQEQISPSSGNNPKQYYRDKMPSLQVEPTPASQQDQILHTQQERSEVSSSNQQHHRRFQYSDAPVSKEEGIPYLHEDPFSSSHLSQTSSKENFNPFYYEEKPSLQPHHSGAITQTSAHSKLSFSKEGRSDAEKGVQSEPHTSFQRNTLTHLHNPQLYQDSAIFHRNNSPAPSATGKKQLEQKWDIRSSGESEDGFLRETGVSKINATDKSNVQRHYANPSTKILPTQESERTISPVQSVGKESECVKTPIHATDNRVDSLHRQPQKESDTPDKLPPFSNESSNSPERGLDKQSSLRFLHDNKEKGTPPKIKKNLQRNQRKTPVLKTDDSANSSRLYEERLSPAAESPKIDFSGKSAVRKPYSYISIKPPLEQDPDKDVSSDFPVKRVTQSAKPPICAKDNGVDPLHRRSPKESDTPDKLIPLSGETSKSSETRSDKQSSLKFLHDDEEREISTPVNRKKRRKQETPSPKSDKSVSSSRTSVTTDHPSIVKDNGISLDHRADSPALPERNTDIAYRKNEKNRITRQLQKGQDLQKKDSQQLHREQEKDYSFDRRSENPLFLSGRKKADSKENGTAAPKEKKSPTQPKDSSDTKGDSQNRKTKKSGNGKDQKQNKTAKKAKTSKLQFSEEEKQPIPGIVKTGIKKTAATTVSATGAFIHRKIHEVEHENAAVEGAHKTELVAERGISGAYREYKKGRKYTQNRTYQKKRTRLLNSDPYQKYFDGSVPSSSQVQPHQKKELFNKFFQKQRHKKQAVQAAQAAKKGTTAVGSAAKTGESVVKRTGSAVKTFAVRHKSAALAVVAILLLFVLLLTLLQSCSVTATESLGSIAASAWPADDTEIKKANLYYTQLEANLQHRINTVESRHSDCEEYYYNIGPIEHDQVALISYLCAKYGSFTFNDEIKQEINRLFNEQYQFDETVKNETRTVTKSVRVGESLGSVVTSGYCNCSICCGQWAGGPTASGAYPQANHTIAVDASNPFVPMGTKVIMNGVEYTVEDTGAFARYGVQFDVFYADHSSASAHGHQTWEAYLADDNGDQTVEVTTTETVKVCYVTLSSKTFTGIVTGNLDSDQLERYNIYNSSRGCRQFLGSPFDLNWIGNISSYYSYRTSPTSGEVEMHNGLDIAMSEGTQILAVQDGTVKTAAYSSSYGNYIIIENNKGYKTLYAHCKTLQVSAGQSVETGDVIATVGSTGNSTGSHLHIEFSYQGEMYNPYFYLSNGTTSIYDDVPEISGDKAQAIFDEAEKYIGMPYVWGGSSPSTSFDCSGFVCYVYTTTGVCNMDRLTAQGIYDICTPISAEQAQPGDLVFFKGTYNTSEVSHVGIYAGNGQMLHCGDPIQYTSINTPYWQSHLFAFGRVGN